MTRDPWTERLSEYLDEDLDRAQREALEAHLRECVDCTAVLEDLARVRARARSLPQTSPPTDLWLGIASAIERPHPVPSPPGRPVRERLPAPRLSFSLPQLVAACLAVAVVSGGAVYAIFNGRAQAPSTHAIPSSFGETGAVVPSSGAAGESPREEAVSEIRQALARGRGTLDPATVKTLEANLAIIEIAIGQAKRAFAADPANSYVREHLANTMKRKVELLQRATMLASASSSEEPR